MFKKFSHNFDKIFKRIAQVYCLIFALIYSFIIITAVITLSRSNPAWTQPMIIGFIKLVIFLVITFVLQVLGCFLIYSAIKKSLSNK